jgi:hypothetical protein
MSEAKATASKRRVAESFIIVIKVGRLKGALH